MSTWMVLTTLTDMIAIHNSGGNIMVAAADTISLLKGLSRQAQNANIRTDRFFITVKGAPLMPEKGDTTIRSTNRSLLLPPRRQGHCCVSDGVGRMKKAAVTRNMNWAETEESFKERLKTRN